MEFRRCQSVISGASQTSDLTHDVNDVSTIGGLSRVPEREKVVIGDDKVVQRARRVPERTRKGLGLYTLATAVVAPVAYSAATLR